MKWKFWPSKSGSTSGDTATVISESVQLVETQTVALNYKQINSSTTKNVFEKSTTYSVYYTRNYDSGFVSYVYKKDYIDDKKEADMMYKHLIESRGKTTHTKTVKEKTFKIESND